MIDLCVLIRYELRKICAKRILWTAFAIVAVISVLILKSGVPANRKVYDDYNGLVWNSSNYDRISSLKPDVSVSPSSFVWIAGPIA